MDEQVNQGPKYWCFKIGIAFEGYCYKHIINMNKNKLHCDSGKNTHEYTKNNMIIGKEFQPMF